MKVYILVHILFIENKYIYIIYYKIVLNDIKDILISKG